MHFTFDYKTLHFKPAIWKRMIDEKLRIKISQNAKLLVQREFDWKEISSKLDKLYKSVGST